MAKPPVVLLRTASILMVLHAAGHTWGMLQGPSHGAEEATVIEAMKGSSFNMMGTYRSYWDFFFGFGLDATINMLLQAGLFWMLAAMAKRTVPGTRALVGLFVAGWVATAVLYVRYFFAAPIVFALVMVVVLGAAWFTIKPAATVR